MRQVCALVCLLVLVLSVAATASETNWRITMRGDDGAGGSNGNAVTIGWGTPYTSGPTDYSSDVTRSDIWLTIEPGVSTSIKAPALPTTWNVRMAALANCTSPGMRLRFHTVSSTTLPTPTYLSQNLRYTITMVNNRGIMGAPANGTTWTLPIPTSHSPNPYYALPLLPVIKLSSASNAAMIAEGYRFEVKVDAVPEPSSVLALGSGLLGLVGCVFRHRNR